MEAITEVTYHSVVVANWHGECKKLTIPSKVGERGGEATENDEQQIKLSRECDQGAFEARHGNGVNVVPRHETSETGRRSYIAVDDGTV